MSKRISRLLEEPERSVAKLIGRLEDHNGYPSHDVRLVAENHQKIRAKLADLGLDPDDTTGPELYHALLAKFGADCRSFDMYFGADMMDFDQKSAKAAQLLSRSGINAKQWALKSKAVKDVLRSLPPKRLMKHLNYRSVESLVKREDLAEICLAAPYIESGNWQRAHNRLVNKLDQTAFEIREPRIITLSVDRWGGIAGPASYVVWSGEVAALAVWPAKVMREAPLLDILLALIDAEGFFDDMKASHIVTHLNGIAAWWTDMDHLIAELEGGAVSLNLKDSSRNHLAANPFDKRSLTGGRKAFWHELLSRYGSLPQLDAAFEDAVRQSVASLKASAPQPVYEFAEELE